MSLIKKPSQLNTHRTLAALIYGQPGVGKTTLACSAPAPILIDLDGGVSRMHGAHQPDTVQASTWEEVDEAMREIVAAGCYQTIVIDTAGKLILALEDYIKKTWPNLAQSDGALTIKGYGTRKQHFSRFTREVLASGLNVIYVAHEIETRDGSNVTVRPEVGGKMGNDLIKELDLVGYMQMTGDARTICFDPTEKAYGKNTVGMGGNIRIPVTVKGAAIDAPNDFMTRMVALYHERLELTRRQAKQCEDAISKGRQIVSAADDAESLNAATAMIAELDHAYNSKAVCWAALSQRGKDLNLAWNRETSTWS